MLFLLEENLRPQFYLLTIERNNVAVVQSLTHVWLFATQWTAALQASLSITISRVRSNSCPLSQRCYPTISSSVNPFASCHQSLPASGSFPMSQLFASGGQRIGASALASVLAMNIQGWFPLGLTGWIFLLSKGLSRVFSSTTFWKHQFFGTQPFLWFNSHICRDYWKNHSFNYMEFCQQHEVSAF